MFFQKQILLLVFTVQAQSFRNWQEDNSNPILGSAVVNDSSPALKSGAGSIKKEFHSSYIYELVKVSFSLQSSTPVPRLFINQETNTTQNSTTMQDPTTMQDSTTMPYLITLPHIRTTSSLPTKRPHTSRYYRRRRTGNRYYATNRITSRRTPSQDSTSLPDPPTVPPTAVPTITDNIQKNNTTIVSSNTILPKESSVYLIEESSVYLPEDAHTSDLAVDSDLTTFSCTARERVPWFKGYLTHKYKTIEAISIDIEV